MTAFSTFSPRCRFLHLLQDEGRDLLRGVVFALGLHPGVAVGALDDLIGHHALVLLDHRVGGVAPDQALDREEGVGRVGHRLALGRLANQALAVIQEGHHRRRGPDAFGVLDHLRRLAVHDRNARIRRAEVDADNLAHVRVSYSLHFGGPRIQGLGSKRPSSCHGPRFDQGLGRLTCAETAVESRYGAPR